MVYIIFKGSYFRAIIFIVRYIRTRRRLFDLRTGRNNHNARKLIDVAAKSVWL